jgi:hypothetical protein
VALVTGEAILPAECQNDDAAVGYGFKRKTDALELLDAKHI